MRLHRIELVTDAMTVELPFHHQTTVVAGLDRLEGEALAIEVLGALHTGRAGLSADISTHIGRRLEVRRPIDGPARVTDVDVFVDVTDEFAVKGVVDPIRALGINATMRLTQADVVRAEDMSSRIQRLAGLDQERLWGLAISMAELDVVAARMTDAQAMDEQISPEAAEQIEEARAEVDMAHERLEELSDQSIIGASALVLISFVVAFLTHPLIAIPFMAAALAVAHRSWNWHQQHTQALAKERSVLEDFGLESYLDFQLRKVDALTDDTKRRREALAIAEKRRHAQEQWTQLVGADVSLDWAATHRPTITTAAHRRALLNSGNEGENEAFSLALADRIRQATSQTEPHLLLIDDIFSAQNDETVDRLLWLIDHHSQQLQFIVVSNDARVLQWAATRTVARQASILRLTDDTDAAPIELDSTAAPALDTSTPGHSTPDRLHI